MHFEEELARTLPADIPHRDKLIIKAGQHLRLVHEANAHMNLTRITDAREAAIKHVYDCVAPWRFFSGAKRVLDAGTGAGFPGVPLAVIFPEIRFTLAESVQKKARFLDAAVETLDLHNAHVKAERAETVAMALHPDLITARAVAPLSRIFELFHKTLRNGTRMLLYKGPDIEKEAREAVRHSLLVEIVHRFELPDGMGTRTLVDVRAKR